MVTRVNIVARDRLAAEPFGRLDDSERRLVTTSWTGQLGANWEAGAGWLPSDGLRWDARCQRCQRRCWARWHVTLRRPYRQGLVKVSTSAVGAQPVTWGLWVEQSLMATQVAHRSHAPSGAGRRVLGQAGPLMELVGASPYNRHAHIQRVLAVAPEPATASCCTPPVQLN